MIATPPHSAPFEHRPPTIKGCARMLSDPSPNDLLRASRSLPPPLGGHATERWARTIVAIVRSAYDPKTLDAWGHVLGASRGTIRTWCYAARLRPKASLDFGRLLRAVVYAQGEPWDLQELLDVVNARTVRVLLLRAGFPEVSPQGVPPSIDAFFERQRLIPRAVGPHLVRTLLERS